MKKILFLLAVSLFAFQMTSFASTDITGNTGDFKIIPPGGGAAIIIKAGQPIPPIVDGSTIEILTGTLTIATTNPSTVIVSAFGNKVDLPSDTSVTLTLDVNGAVKVADASGTSTVKSLDGKITLLKPGSSIVIAGNAEAYHPPALDLGPVNTQVQIDDHRKDISAQ